jgi:plasmid stabilization system protein ParE
MNPAFRKSPLFTADVQREFVWYWDEAGEDMAWRFEAAVERTLLSLAWQPGLGRKRSFRHPVLRELRSLRVEPPFKKLLIFYRAGDDGIEVWRLMHGARDLPRRLLDPLDVASD